MAHVIRKIDYAGFKNCIYISNTVCEAVITTEVGPRILRYSRVGYPNLLYVDEYAAGQTEETKTWRAYGGHSFDVVLDGKEHLKPENVSVPYTLSDDGIYFEAVDFEGYKKTVSVRMCRRGGLEIKETVENTSEAEVKVSLMGNTLLCNGGTMAVPCSARKHIFGEFCELEPDLRCTTVGKNLTLVKQDPLYNTENKLAFDLDEMWCGYFTKGSLFVMTTPETEGTYRNGRNFYYECSPKNVKISSVSPETVLKKGESLTHTEVWNIFDTCIQPESEDRAGDMLRDKKFYYEFVKMPVKGIDF